MFAKKKLFGFLIVILLGSFVSMVLVQPKFLKLNLFTEASSSLRTWVGDYTFSEYAPPDEICFIQLVFIRKTMIISQKFISMDFKH